jgi:pimeloyl-ACP methyl ester carboxylesterase
MARGRLDRQVWSRDLAAILTTECYPSALLIGHSLGAQIAVDFAWRYPDLAQGLVLIDPVFHRALIGRQRALYRLRLFVRVAAWGTRLLNGLGLRRNRFPDRDLRLLDEKTREALRGDASLEEIARRYGALGPILRHMPTANYLQQLLATVDPLPDLATIRCPVLVVLSAGSTFAETAINREEIERFPRAEVATVAANHWPLSEKPDEVRRAIEAWVEETAGGRAGP